ncbi:hypothetical protein [Methylobacterium nigriterrae]|uniref:hypothetical protein n=1 Tax=Methylobacterium nigriterrae TaxID=3127512 RepID=UPI0030137F98
MRGWWAVAARMLTLVLALVVAAPVSGLADDMAFHAGGHHERTEALTVGSPSSADASDPGVASHVHCGCHQVAAMEHGPVPPAPDAARPRYARVTDVPSSVATNRLPRPPRA